MARRYEFLYKNTGARMLAQCPVILLAHALVKDTRTGGVFLQCKFQNMGQKPVEALYLRVDCFGVDAKPLKGVDEFVYLDLNAGRYAMFGEKQPVYLPDPVSRNCKVYLSKVVFKDNTIWKPQAGAAFLTPPPQEGFDKLGPYAAQYQRELTAHLTPTAAAMQSGLAGRWDEYWQCGCGTWNREGDAECHRCGAPLKTLLTIRDRELLKSDYEKYKVLKKERLEQKLREDDKSKLRRARRRGALLRAAGALAVLALVGGGIWYGMRLRPGDAPAPASARGAALLTAVRQDGLWGYADADGVLAVEPAYEEAYAYAACGLARVKQGGRYGFLDRAGALVIPARYEDARDFTETGHAAVRGPHGWGVIDAEGNVVVPLQYEDVQTP